MICINGSTDSNDSAISFSPPSLSSSPVKSLAIQQLLSSPIINTPQTALRAPQIESDSDLDINDESNDILGTATSDPSWPNSQSSQTDLPAEVAASEPTDSQSEPSSATAGRSPFLRQSSVCLNAKMTSSPRALAILKNAIKTSYNTNKVCDKPEVSRTTIDSAVVNGTHSPPNGKSFRSSPLSRGSALLKAAKERLEKRESERSPKISCNLFSMSVDSNLEKRLTSILRKRQLNSSPTSGDMSSAKRKKVLFAEPVVSSELEFRPSPSADCFRTFAFNTVDSSLDREVEELTNDKKRNNLVHQNSTFDNEFEITYGFGENSPPMLFSEHMMDEEPVVPSCEPEQPSDNNTEEEVANTDSQELSEDSSQATDPLVSESQSSEDLVSEDEFQCSQAMPVDSQLSEVSSMLSQDSESHQNIGVQTDSQDLVTDPVVHIPMRLSLVQQLYAIFGNIIREYSSDNSQS